jgi:hypothetical protein
MAHALLDKVASSIDGAIAWHLQELAKLCPDGTRFTLIARVPHVPDACLVLGNEPNTKQALFMALRATNSRQHSRAGVKPVEGGEPVAIGMEVVEGAPAAAPGEVDFLNLNGGVLGG